VSTPAPVGRLARPQVPHFGFNAAELSCPEHLRRDRKGGQGLVERDVAFRRVGLGLPRVTRLSAGVRFERRGAQLTTES
jgi:hypothetical protein